MLRDQYGFMWFATLNGLNRYDGYQCKQYWVTDSDTYSNLYIYKKKEYKNKKNFFHLYQSLLQN